MCHNTGCLPVPGDVWGLDILDPLKVDEWTRTQWQDISKKPPAKPLVLRYLPSAERTALRILRTFARLAGDRDGEIVCCAPERTSLLLPQQGEGNCGYIIHRASRFLNLRERLNDSIKQRYSFAILSVAADELACLPPYLEYELRDVPHVDAATESDRAKKFLAHSKDEPESPDDVRRLFALLAEAGAAGIEISVDLVSRSLDLPLEKTLIYLCYPEICDFIRLSQEGPMGKRVVSFRGAWLAKALAGEARAKGYPVLQSVLSYLDPDEDLDRDFLLRFMVALRSQGFTNLCRKEWQDKIRQVRQAGDDSERYAWFLFEHRDLLNFISYFRVMSEQGIRYFAEAFNNSFHWKRRLSMIQYLGAFLPFSQ